MTHTVRMAFIISMASVKMSTYQQVLISRTEDSQGLSDLNSILTIPLTHLFILSGPPPIPVIIRELEEKVESPLP